MKTKNINEPEIAREYLYASKNDISIYSQWMRLYGEYKFKDKVLGKLIKKVREAFYHDGTEKDIKKFWDAHNELKTHLK
jgi:hypothetical protein